ncbi:MAG TPA: nuclear transport factor 2 family protein [Gemmatimonadales bacterium]
MIRTHSLVPSVLALLAAFAAPARAQSAADSAAIRATALDYIDGWYDGDAARMERALHPHLAKRQVYQDDRGRSRLADMTAMELVQATRSGAGTTPPAERRDAVTILNQYGNAAMVRVDAISWVDYLQEVKWNGRWVIVNVVWVDRPGTGD